MGKEFRISGGKRVRSGCVLWGMQRRENTRLEQTSYNNEYENVQPKEEDNDTLTVMRRYKGAIKNLFKWIWLFSPTLATSFDKGSCKRWSLSGGIFHKGLQLTFRKALFLLLNQIFSVVTAWFWSGLQTRIERDTSLWCQGSFGRARP